MVRAVRSALAGGLPVAEPSLRDLLFVMHRLSGAAGVFGFASLSDAARRLESAILQGDGSHSTIGDLLAELDSELAAIGSRAGKGCTKKRRRLATVPMG